jgi:hypothetical protein
MNESMSRSALGRSLVLALVLAAATFGVCCLIDGASHDEHGPSPDVCLTVLTMAAAPTPAVGLFLQGWATIMPPVPVRSAWVFVLTPPPRSL